MPGGSFTGGAYFEAWIESTNAAGPALAANKLEQVGSRKKPIAKRVIEREQDLSVHRSIGKLFFRERASRPIGSLRCLVHHATEVSLDGDRKTMPAADRTSCS